MHKRSIIFLVILALVFLAVALYFTPSITPVELSLDAVKLDMDGNELGTVQISMIGSKMDYLFQPSRIDVNIQPFDGIAFLKPSYTHIGFSVIPGMIQSFPRRDFLYAYYGGTDSSGEDIVFADLGFSPDMKQWIIVDHTNHVYYIASVDGTYSTQELVEYFNGLI